MQPETREIPAAALRFDAGPVEFAKLRNNEDRIPVSMRARQAVPIDHWYWGRIVHDMAGLNLHKPSIPVDYCHYDEEVLGFLDNFDTGADQTEDLTVSGYLVPYRLEDRVHEITHKAGLGVPYEASIFFSDYTLEWLGENIQTKVNGRMVEGPLYIVRQWTLRGVAICPYGADKGTETRLADSGPVTITLFSKDGTMPTAKKAAPPADKKAQEAAPPNAPPPADPPDQDAAPPADPPGQDAAPPDAPPGQDAAPGQRYLDAFGDLGGRWFAEGKSFDEAQALYLAHLQTQLETLTAERDEARQRLAQIDLGDEEPADFSAPGQAPAAGPDAADVNTPEARLGSNLARAAAGINLPGKQPAP
jgi:hypothetical protein